ncbi:MAG: Crp/Fnr family transcriptional regulator [Myxococcaceae bacterium]|nr:Crp/Fnr family transcriptional regulator [Myxococcaceae bacterium]
MELDLSLYPFVRELSVRGTEALRSAARPVRLEARQALQREGEPVRRLLLLQTGQLRVYKSSAAGREITLFRVRPGQCCLISLASLLSDTPYPAEVQASAPTQGIEVPADAFRRLHETEPAVRKLVNESTARQLTELMALVAEVAFRRMDVRLARHLLDEARAGRSVMATHDALAAHLGTAREVVSRLLENFGDDGLIETGRGRVELLDRAALERLVAEASGR